jgi:phenylacetate-coenzyme A ligase PaaK-like adenylate-forming protein
MSAFDFRLSTVDFPPDRHPLIDEEGLRTLRALREHADAPRFNHATGDRLRREDVPVLDAYREALASRRGPREPGAPTPEVLARCAAWSVSVPWARRAWPRGISLETEFASLPTTSRVDLARAPWEFVPDDEPLDRLVIYRTAGTTGHPISVPHSPVAIRCYEPLLEHALSRWGKRAPHKETCFLVGAQIRTYTYAAVLHAWGGTGFAKLNIRQTEWPRAGSQRRYFEAFSPSLLTGDAISFAEMLRMELPARPSALVTTSVAISPGLKARLAAAYEAPVIDWYSLVETGPIGYGCAKGKGFHVLPHDVHVEAVKPDGSPCAPGERGEITVTGGRNPLFPLLRYRTGDYGRVAYEACECGDPMPRLLELEGRAPVLFRSSDGTPVSTVDLSRLLREHPLLLHEFTQRNDRSCELVYRALPNASPDPAAIAADLARVLGDVRLELREDEALGDRVEGKVRAYKSDLMLEE